VRLGESSQCAPSFETQAQETSIGWGWDGRWRCSLVFLVFYKTVANLQSTGQQSPVFSPLKPEKQSAVRLLSAGLSVCLLG
jgi:hypothetical protein